MNCYGHTKEKKYCPYEDSCEVEKIDITTCADSLFGNYIASNDGYCKRDDKKGENK